MDVYGNHDHLWKIMGVICMIMVGFRIFSFLSLIPDRVCIHFDCINFPPVRPSVVVNRS